MKRISSLLVGLGLLLSSPVSAQDTPFRVTHPDLPNGCAAPADQPGSGWSAYLTMLEGRLNRPVVGCGSDDPAGDLQSGTVDLALVTAGLDDDKAQGLRPILRIRHEGQLSRTEVLVLGASAGTDGSAGGSTGGSNETFMPGSAPEDAVLAASSLNEMTALTALHLGRTLDDPSTEEAARTLAGDFARTWPPGAFLSDPVPALTRLKAGSTGEPVYMTLGRFRELCARAETLCEGPRILWQGFIPLSTAFAVREDLALELRYRLIGIHVALHVDHPDMVQTLGGPTAVELEPTDPTAFTFHNGL